MGATELNVNKITALIKGFLSKFRSNESDLEEDIKFKPDPLEIAETSPPGFSFWALYGVLALLLIAILWASLSKIDVVIVAKGDMAMPERTVVVQPLETSIIRSINVSVGDVVSAGESLGTLDATFTEADVSQLQIRLSDLTANIERLEAELSDKKYTPEGDTPAIRLQKTVYDDRKKHFVAQLNVTEEQVATIEASIKTNLSQLKILSERENILKELESMRTKLIEKGGASKKDVLEIKDTRLRISQDVKKLESELYEQKHQLKSAISDKEAFVSDWRRKIGEELVDLKRNSSEVKEQLQKAELRENRVNLTAPLDGTVLEIADLNIGSVVQVAEPLFTIVPSGTVVRLDVEIPASDIGFIKVGNSARIKFDAYPFQKHGTAQGRVLTISEDVFNDEKTPNNPMYRASVELVETDLRNLPAGFRLIPGMSGQAEIKVGRRSVISYFTYPFIRGLDESIREP